MRDYYKEAMDLYGKNHHEEAYRLFEQGANVGEEKCFFGIAWLLNYGQYVEQNTKKAEEIFGQHFDAILDLANDGDAEAMYLVGRLYLNGLGVTKSIDKSLEWIEKSAIAGCSSAQNALGNWYDFGTNVTQSYTEAIKYLIK